MKDWASGWFHRPTLFIIITFLEAQMRIGPIDLDQEVMIVAEVGNNHEGSFALAEEMIGRASETGVHAVKFQTIVPERLVSSNQKDRLQQLKRFQLSVEQFQGLAELARQKGLLFLSTPFDLESAAVLEPLVPAYKVASGDNTFYPLLERVASTGKPILLSSGMLSLEGVRKSRDFIRRIWREKGIEQGMALLHCVTSYPTPPHEANLGAIEQLKTLGETVGYSDHTLGIRAAVLSAALGARVIEKHFTVDKKRSGFRDHALSADPEEMRQLVQGVQEVKVLVGSGEKEVMASERGNLDAARRSIAAAADLSPGTRLGPQDLLWVRPGNGLAPGREQDLIGRVLKRRLQAGEILQLSDLEEEG
jgi:N,N'-diacetyllegionaminate synthase